MAATLSQTRSSRTRRGAGRLGDRLFCGGTLLLAAAMLLILALMLLKMTQASRPALGAFGLRFPFSTDWDPVRESFGALPFIYGTVASSLIALALAVPLSLAVAVFLAELAPWWLRGPAGMLIELLAAVPSVVYGLWGIFVLAPWLRDSVQPVLQGAFGFLPLFQGPPIGIGLLAAGIILAIMITPIISAVAREVLLSVPRTQREAMLALGATRWETVRMVVLPYGRSGLIGGVILGLGRALGETMAVTMVIGNRPEISLSVFEPSYSMAAVIANEFSEATSDLHLAALIEIGLVLFAITVIVNAAGRLLTWRVAGAARGVVRD